MAYLRRLPIDELKVDRAFIAEMGAIPTERTFVEASADSDGVIVRSAIDLGHNLGLTVVAEGVEDSATLDALSQAGCDRAQGYHIARPMPAAQLRNWLVDNDHGVRPDFAADNAMVGAPNV